MKVDPNVYLAMLDTPDGVLNVAVLKRGDGLVMSGVHHSAIGAYVHTDERIAYHIHNDADLLESILEQQGVEPECWVEVRVHDYPLPDMSRSSLSPWGLMAVRTGTLHSDYGYVVAQAASHSEALTIAAHTQFEHDTKRATPRLSLVM